MRLLDQTDSRGSRYDVNHQGRIGFEMNTLLNLAARCGRRSVCKELIQHFECDLGQFRDWIRIEAVRVRVRVGLMD